MNSYNKLKMVESMIKVYKDGMIIYGSAISTKKVIALFDKLLVECE